jgi:hypothetical protein
LLLIFRFPDYQSLVIVNYKKQSSLFIKSKLFGNIEPAIVNPRIKFCGEFRLNGLRENRKNRE